MANISLIKRSIRIIIKQSVYQAVAEKFFLNLIARRLFYRFFFRKILYYTIVIKALSWPIQVILLFVSISSRITIVGEENLRKIEEKSQGAIFAFWHGHYTLLLASLRPEKAVALVHLSFRGNYLTELFSAFNYHIVRTSRNGRSILKFIKKLEEGYLGFIAVDGPRGPSYKTKPGTIYIAQRAKAMIVPLTIEAHRGVVLGRRWDRHFIPLPFNKITVFIGRPIEVNPGDSLKTKAMEVNRSLLKLP
jgi:lysophospholipid acyltransferase (LPLAT)-like uncharacterized protein